MITEKSYSVVFYYEMQKSFLSVGARVRWLSTTVFHHAQGIMKTKKLWML